MKYEKVYQLSKSYGPPEWDLQSAEIADEWGDNKYAQREINHNSPEDVSKEDFLYYTQIYVHMDLESLLFYLYPIALEYEKDSRLWDRVDSFIYALNCKAPEKFNELKDSEIEALSDGLLWIYEAHGEGDKDWLKGHTGKLIIDKVTQK